ncbi:MAG: hypothetical protein F4240_11775, partial [Acidimicrobiia bacterium]|nr:hypothetical protein [Acidimicrobiia bacterium]
MPVRKTIPVLVSVVAMVAATFTAVTVWAQEPRPPEVPPPADPELFYSGPVIDGPGFCWYRSLGGQRTYAFDQNEDGVAETCSLPRSRREAIARQLAMEQLARRQFGRFAELFDEECQNVAETYGDPNNETADHCAAYRAGESRPPGSPPLVPLLSTDPTVFYSGPTITGRDYCTNYSFGAPRLYGFDSDDDGVADVCSLYSTKRASVARQWALERLAKEQSGMFYQYFEQECQEVAQSYGEPTAEANDACVDSGETKPLPTETVPVVNNRQPPPPPPPPPPAPPV